MYRYAACKKRYCTVSDGIKEDKAIRFAYRALVQFIGSEMPSERLPHIFPTSSALVPRIFPASSAHLPRIFPTSSHPAPHPTRVSEG